MKKYCNCAIGQTLKYFKLMSVEELFRLHQYRPDIYCKLCKCSGILYDFPFDPFEYSGSTEEESKENSLGGLNYNMRR